VTILVTGAAGFLGSHAVRSLIGEGRAVVATDRVPDQEAVRLLDIPRSDLFRYVPGELVANLSTVMPGVTQVWHFAANADIPLGARDTFVDMRDSILLTQQVLESMRDHRVRSIVFPSTGGVYGNRSAAAARENEGPLLPVSLYAAGKLGSEALISAYAHMFDIRGMIFRLGNVVGGSMGRGIVRDFIAKLRADPRELPVLGDGRQRKSYVLVDDVLAGIRWIDTYGPKDDPVQVYNLAAGDSLSVAEVGEAVAAAMGLPMPRLRIQGHVLAWAGDQPVIALSIEKALATGWTPMAKCAEAVKTATIRLLAEVVDQRRSPHER
jgi:UDP-glucose 4-epimerase